MNTVFLEKWDAYAVRLIKEKGFRGMPESAAIDIFKDAAISPKLLTLTYLDIIFLAGHGRDPRPVRAQRMGVAA